MRAKIRLVTTENVGTGGYKCGKETTE